MRQSRCRWRIRCFASCPARSPAGNGGGTPEGKKGYKARTPLAAGPDLQGRAGSHPSATPAIMRRSIPFVLLLGVAVAGAVMYWTDREPEPVRASLSVAEAMSSD